VLTHLFSPASTFWRVNREWLLTLSGPRALLLELAHPLVAAGVAQRSNYKGDPLGRLYRTLWVMTDINFGDGESARRAVQRIHGCHASVSGSLAADVGPYLAGTPYQANDPLLKLWVLATLVDSIWVVHDLLLRPLTLAEKQAYYRDTQVLGRALGIPPEMMPPTYDDFLDYVDSMLTSDLLTVGDDARAIVRALLYAPGLGPVIRAASFVSIGLLPERLRLAYGFEWDEGRERWLRRWAALSRTVWPRLPTVLRSNPRAVWAEWQAAIRTQPPYLRTR
jgi:uncharacterized protein (DUF2236 family)